MFSPEDPKTLKITPLGAALVEAMPDRILMRVIQNDFKKSGKCPTSLLFPTIESIETFYKADTYEQSGK